MVPLGDLGFYHRRPLRLGRMDGLRHLLAHSRMVDVLYPPSRATVCRRTRVRSAMPLRGFTTLRNPLITLGSSTGSDAPSIGFVQDPDDSQARPRQQVEGYLQ